MSDYIEIGAHLVSSRFGYAHHGIYVGNNFVVHYSGSLSGGINDGLIEEISLDEFTDGNGYSIKEHYNAKYDGSSIVIRARSRIGENLYCVFSNNCEHFCEWCINDDHNSKQISNGTAIVSSTGASSAGLAARGIVAASGSVLGLSGSGIMSGLASAGSIIGGGAVAGIGVLGAVPGVAMASLGTCIK